MTTYKLYCHLFWPGFVEGTDPLTLSFFLKLFTRVFECPIEHTTNLEEADILFESIGFGDHGSKLQEKSWKYKILFSGESRLCEYYEDYDCILWGKESQGKIIRCPLFLPYMISSGAAERVLYMDQTRNDDRKLPQYKKILAIISSPNGRERNQILDILERYFPIEYAGRYKTNRSIIEHSYWTPEFWEEVKKYRCVVCMENSRDTDYLTEKITHGFACGNVPIYWGAKNVTDYFNPNRFIHINEIDDENIMRVVQQIHRTFEDDDYFKSVTKQPIFKNNMNGEELIESQIDRIVKEMRSLLNI